MIQEDCSLHKRLDKLDDMIQSLQATSRADTPPPKTSTVTCVTRQPQRQFPASRPNGEARDNGQKPSQNRRQFIRPVNVDVDEPRRTQTATNRSVSGSGLPSGRGNPNQNLVRAGASGGSDVQRPPGWQGRGRELSLRLPSYTSNGRCLWWRGISPGRGLKRLDHVIQLLQEFVGFVDSGGATLYSMRLAINLHPYHGQGPLTSVGRVVSNGV